MSGEIDGSKISAHFYCDKGDDKVRLDGELLSDKLRDEIIRKYADIALDKDLQGSIIKNW
jgi:hypothetical protein